MLPLIFFDFFAFFLRVSVTTTPRFGSENLGFPLPSFAPSRQNLTTKSPNRSILEKLRKNDFPVQEYFKLRVCHFYDHKLCFFSGLRSQSSPLKSRAGLGWRFEGGPPGLIGLWMLESACPTVHRGPTATFSKHEISRKVQKLMRII